MTLRILLALGAFIAASPATAQTQSAPVAPGLGGPIVPGVCLLSREAIFANAAIGKAATARLEELTRAAQAEIEAQRAPLEAEVRALEGQAAADQTGREALATRWQALQQQAAHTSREIEATRVRALERIANEAQPVITEVYGRKNCGLLFDRNTALGGNFANDLTAEVVGALDARVQTITFERETLPQQPAASAQ